MKVSCECGRIRQKGTRCACKPKRSPRPAAIRYPGGSPYDHPLYRRNKRIILATYQPGISRCIICGSLIAPGQVTVEHIVGLRQGGHHSLSNLALACHCQFGWRRNAAG